MKIILFNPQIEPQSPLVKGLAQRGLSVLAARSRTVAKKLALFHGESVDLFIMHGDEGMECIKELRTLPEFKKTPWICTSDTWGPKEFAQHQATPDAANAYISSPLDEIALTHLIESITGQTLKLIEETQETAPSEFSMESLPPTPGISLTPPPMEGTTEQDLIQALGSSTPQPPAFTTPLEVLTPVEEITKTGLTYNANQNGETSGGFTIQLELPSDDDTGETSAESALAPPELQVPETSTALTSTATLNPAEPIEITFAPTGIPDKLEISTFIQAAKSAEDAYAPPTITRTIPLENPAALLQQAESQVPEFTFAADALPDLTAMAQTPEPVRPAQKASAKAVLAPPPPADDEVAPPPPPEEKPSAVAEEPSVDTEAFEAMPYVFSGKEKKAPAGAVPYALDPAFAQPIGDSVVPGGAVNAPDTETLKRYLLLREQDVAALSAQLKSAQERIASLEETLRMERARNVELAHTVQEHDKKVSEKDQEHSLVVQKLENEAKDLRFQLMAKGDKAKTLEFAVKEAQKELEIIKDRVRNDIRKIRVREKELENKLEIVKKDSEAMLASRETKIIDLKRKIDLLEFNMDLVQDQYTREKDKNEELREKLKRVSQIVRAAGGFLENKDDAANSDSTVVSETEQKAS